MDNSKLIESLEKPKVFDNDFNRLSISRTFYDEINDLMKKLHLNTTTFCYATELNKTILSDMKSINVKMKMYKNADSKCTILASRF